MTATTSSVGAAYATAVAAIRNATQQTLQARNATTSNDATLLPSATQGPDTAKFSSISQLLNESKLLLPTAENVRALSSAFSAKLSAFYAANGISTNPPVTLTMDVNTGRISVTSDRPDAQRIEELLNAQSDIGHSFHTLIGISSHAYVIPEHLRFQQEYRSSMSPDAVVAKYSHLFRPQMPVEFSLRFNGALDLCANGRTWHTAA